MTFEEWAVEYFGKDVDFPEACRDAWNCATVTRTGAEEMVMAEREQCAEICENADFGNCWTDDSDYDAGMLKGAQICADAIRTRSNASLRGAEPALSANRPSRSDS